MRSIKSHNFRFVIFILCISGIINLQSCDLANSKKKVLVVHIRGASYPALMNFLKTEASSHSFLKKTFDNNYLKQLRPIENAVTITNIASFETGTVPQVHGIPGHAYGVYEQGYLKQQSGFSKRYDVESFWEKADAQGLKVLSVGALVQHGKFTEHENVDCLAQGSLIQPGRFLSISKSTLGDNSGITYVDEKNRSVILLNEDLNVRIYDGASDEIIIDGDSYSENGVLGKLTEGNWVEIISRNETKLSEAVRVKWIKARGDQIDLYVRASFTNRGYPDSFLTLIDKKEGPAKGWPNIPAFAANRISAETLIEETEAEMDYVLDAFESASNEKEYDLIMIDYPLLDRFGHAFLQLSDTSNLYSQYFKDAWRKLDRDLNELNQFASENNYKILFASTHGFSPLHTSIDINYALRSAGVKQDTKNWLAKGIAGKVSSHIYLNPKLARHQQDSILKLLYNLFQ